jgi:hypothetical protein
MNIDTKYTSEYFPSYINTPILKIFENDLQKRYKFTEFIFNNKDIFDNTINNINKIVLESKSIMWIGGSRSWYNLIEQNYKNLVLNEIEMTSILPGNYDIFCITNNEKDVKNILCKIKIEFDKLYDIFIKQFNIYKCYSSLTLKTRNDKCTLINKNQNLICVFDPCYSLHLRIDTKENKEINFDCEKGKTLIYFECIVLPNKDLLKIKQDLFIQNSNNINHLNFYGLYLFSELILSSRISDKGYNIDYYRNLILKRILKGQDELKVYKTLINYYNYLFKGTDNYKDYDMDNLLKNYINIDNPDLLNNYESELIEKLRIYVNSFIYNNIQPLLTNDDFIFEVGGDAMRRYINTITQTNDFDFKLYYKSDFKQLKDTIILEMCKFTTFLYDKKYIIFKHTSKSSKNYILNSLSNKSGQFRIRFSKKSEELPIDLLSMDYRYRLNVKIDSNIFKVKISIPFLDIVLQENIKNIKVNEVVNKSILFPIASSKFLYDDLISIYTEYINAKARFNNNKQTKDQKRFNALKYFLFNQYLNNYYYQNSNKRKRNELIELRKVIDINSPKKIKDTTKENVKNLTIKLYQNDNNLIGNNLNKIIDINKWNDILYSSSKFKERYHSYFKYFSLKEKKYKKDTKIQLGFNDIRIISNMTILDQSISLSSVEKYTNKLNKPFNKKINKEDESYSEYESDNDLMEIDVNENFDILNQLENMTLDT